MESVKVVVHFKNGRLVKGSTQDFFPNRPRFHVAPNDGAAPKEVNCGEIKALYFVKTFEGNANRQDVRGFLSSPSETAHGKKLAVLFSDGELVCGYSLAYTPGRDGFIMFPADAGSNNLRIYVVVDATTEIKAGPAADQLAERVLARTES